MSSHDSAHASTANSEHIALVERYGAHNYHLCRWS